MQIWNRVWVLQVCRSRICSVGFGFCEYADPESTLRALRLLHNLKLGEKSLVVSTDGIPIGMVAMESDSMQAKVDAKTRKDLLKYLLTRKHIKKNESFTEGEVMLTAEGGRARCKRLEQSAN